METGLRFQPVPYSWANAQVQRGANALLEVRMTSASKHIKHDAGRVANAAPRITSPRAYPQGLFLADLEPSLIDLDITYAAIKHSLACFARLHRVSCCGASRRARQSACRHLSLPPSCQLPLPTPPSCSSFHLHPHPLLSPLFVFSYRPHRLQPLYHVVFGLGARLLAAPACLDKRQGGRWTPYQTRCDAPYPSASSRLLPSESGFETKPGAQAYQERLQGSLVGMDDPETLAGEAAVVSP